MKAFSTLVTALVLCGCTASSTKSPPEAKSSDGIAFWFTPERVVYASKQSLWLQRCVNELVSRNQSNEVRWFNGIGANDVAFMPEDDPAEEIFQKCINIEPLSADKASLYKKWLQEHVSEIRGITTGITRKELSKILLQNGGIFTPDAVTYSHIECPVLKVRIEFELVSDIHADSHLNGNDKVKAVSMPYLGLFICD